MRAVYQVEVVDELKYLIKWSGLSYQFCTWETREEVSIHSGMLPLYCQQERVFLCVWKRVTFSS